MGLGWLKPPNEKEAPNTQIKPQWYGVKFGHDGIKGSAIWVQMFVLTCRATSIDM